MLRLGSSIHDPAAMWYFSSGTGLDVDSEFRCRLPPMLVPTVLLLMHMMLRIQYDERKTYSHGFDAGVRHLQLGAQYAHWLGAVARRLPPVHSLAELIPHVLHILHRNHKPPNLFQLPFIGIGTEI